MSCHLRRTTKVSDYGLSVRKKLCLAHFSPVVGVYNSSLRLTKHRGNNCLNWHVSRLLYCVRYGFSDIDVLLYRYRHVDGHSHISFHCDRKGDRGVYLDLPDHTVGNLAFNVPDDLHWVRVRLLLHILHGHGHVIGYRDVNGYSNRHGEGSLDLYIVGSIDSNLHFNRNRVGLGDWYLHDLLDFVGALYGNCNWVGLGDSNVDDSFHSVGARDRHTDLNRHRHRLGNRHLHRYIYSTRNLNDHGNSNGDRDLSWYLHRHLHRYWHVERHRDVVRSLYRIRSWNGDLDGDLDRDINYHFDRDGNLNWYWN